MGADNYYWGLRGRGDDAADDNLRAEHARFKKALEKITKLGTVCPNFELCRHPSCRDSCGAVLMALEALGSPRQGPAGEDP